MTATNATDALLADLRDRAWLGDAEAQRRFLDIGARKSATAAATLAEIEKMIEAKIWQTTGATQ
jgi:hypothetical protein